MTQVNLVPDIKQKYLKAQRMKRVIMVGAFFVSAAFITVVVLMFIFVNVAQKRHNANLEKDIASSVKEFQAEGDAAKILTLQKQLESLPGLHANKPQMSRLSLYLAQVVPSGVGLDELSLDMEKKEIVIRGGSANVKAVNTFIDTLKNAKYTVEGQNVEADPPKNAFTTVILNAIGANERTGDVTYRLTIVFDPKIFTESKQVNLSVPNITSTQSELEKPKVFGEQVGN